MKNSWEGLVLGGSPIASAPGHKRIGLLSTGNVELLAISGSLDQRVSGVNVPRSRLAD